MRQGSDPRPALSARAPRHRFGHRPTGAPTTTTPTAVTFVGVKGGVGTSTVAAMHALTLARSGLPVRLTASDSAGIEDLAALLAVPAPAPDRIVEICWGLTLADHTADEEANVVDAGTDRFSHHAGAVYLVLRNDYLSLRRALEVPRTTLGAVLLNEPRRPLGRRDVEEVLCCPIVAELLVEPGIARILDAGLLASARNIRLALIETSSSSSA